MAATTDSAVLVNAETGATETVLHDGIVVVLGRGLGGLRNCTDVRCSHHQVEITWNSDLGTATLMTVSIKFVLCSSEPLSAHTSTPHAPHTHTRATQY